MTFEKTLQSMFDHYPGLFQERSDCLDHLFCVIGNGFEWVNGELVDGDIKPPKHKLVNRKATQHLPNPYKNIPYLNLPRHKKWYFVYKTPSGEPDQIVLYKNYAHLWDYPDDITPSWKGGLKECVQLLLEDHIIQESDLNSEGLPIREGDAC